VKVERRSVCASAGSRPPLGGQQGSQPARSRRGAVPSAQPTDASAMSSSGSGHLRSVSMVSAFEGLAALVERIVNPADNVVALRR